MAERKKKQEEEKLALLKAQEEERQMREAEEKEAQLKRKREEEKLKKMKELEKQKRIKRNQQLEAIAQAHYKKVLLTKKRSRALEETENAKQTKCPGSRGTSPFGPSEEMPTGLVAK